MIILISLIVSVVTAFQPQTLYRPKISYNKTRRRKILQPPHHIFHKRYDNILLSATNNDDVEYPRDLLQKFASPLESSTDAASTFVPSEDTPLANSYYLKLQQAKKLKEKEVSENIEAETIEKTPISSDLSSKEEEVVSESSKQDSSPETTADDSSSTVTTTQSRDTVSIEEEQEGDSVSSSSVDTETATTSMDTSDIQEITDDMKATDIVSSIEEEDISTSTTETSKDTTEELVIDTSNDNPTTTSPQSSSSEQLIQTQPATTFSFDKLTLPTNNLDVEAYGLLPLIIIGVSLSLAVGVYMNQSGDQNKKEESEDDDSKNLLQKVKDAGTAGAISYALWEATFWGVSFIVGLFSYYKLTGHWPDLTNADDTKKISLNAFLFVNVARLAVPLRIGLALATVPWVEANILSRFGNKEQDEENTISESEQVTMTSDLNSGIDPTLLQKKKKKYVPGDNTGNIEDYCEPGKVDEECAESVKDYLDNIAETGKVASDDEAKTIVNYLDSLSSNITPPNGSTTGRAFTTYLDALSQGSIASPSSAKAVQTYLNVLSTDQDSTSTHRVEEVEDRLSRLEGSLNNMPEEIATRLDDWQIQQDEKMKKDMEKILSLLADK